MIEMLNHYVGLLNWLFQIAFFCTLLVALTYARRLDRLLRQVRSDHALLQSALPQIDLALTKAATATDRLAHDLRRSETALGEATESAEAITRKLDDSISRAVQLLASPPKQTPPPEVARPPAPAVTPRTPAVSTSRAERDLARMLIDAS
ncbi:MAG: hypothetical protein B7Z58_07995 [Acidiphilium sp. 37-64-53]|uniref:hypothetical protein n=1 Tax=Acidiphilium TaxID=522 RepID=UPI000BCC2AC5|nr:MULTISPECIES: hypothetical protein [Acidiphilium]OYW02398.1 MAG: hypothetical protein B7Z58_07995 [Acidiphilium sp. 37-64-53]OZB30202.1 MAG: hypothetical protein B7X49_04125 [Acidiphilium sp. 34-64-41]HQT84542.1 hypothetical protein [Acidiphilium rubrum]